MKNIYKKINAFTLAEILVVFVIIAVIASATIGLQKSRTDYVNKFMYYASYNNIKNIVSEMKAEGITTTTPNTTYVQCDPHLDTCVPCDPATDTTCVPCNPEDQDCTPCDPNHDSNCLPCLPATQQWCTGVTTHDGSYPNFAAIQSAYTNWYDMYGSYKSCYDTQMGSTDSQGADAICMPQYNIVGAKAAYMSYYPSGFDPCKPMIKTDFDVQTRSGSYLDNSGCPDTCYPSNTQGRTGSTGYKPKSSQTTWDTKTTKNLPAKGTDLCKSLVDKLNIMGNNDCTATATSNFGSATPNFTTTNGMSWFNLGADPSYIGAINSYVIGTGTDYANEVYTVYIDIDGKKRGPNTPNIDVMKFFITRDGTILPAQDSSGAIDTKYLSTSVRYKLDGKYVWLVQGVSYKDAACSADGGTGKIVPTVFNYCVGATINTATSNTCKTPGITCEVYSNKPGL